MDTGNQEDGPAPGQWLSDYLAGGAAVEDAELAARGVWAVSVVHGDPEDPEDADLIYRQLHQLAGQSGTLTGYRAGNDYTTFLFSGAGADDAAVALIAAASAIARRWWRITPTSQPVWRGR